MPVTIRPGIVNYKDPVTGNYVQIDTLSDNLAGLVAPNYEDLVFPVSTGQLCCYEGALYKAIQNISQQENWSAIHWTVTNVETETNALKNSKADKTDTVFVTTISRGRKANTTVGTASFAFGNDITASGTNSHAEGASTTASGNQSHAEGGGATASGRYSHAEGAGTIANHASQHVSGEFNIADPSLANSSARGNYAEIIGNGTTYDNRSNARTLDWSGNEHLAGDVYVHANADGTGGSKLPDETRVNQLISTAVGSSTKADKADTVLDTTLSRGRKANSTVGTGSFAFGSDVEASGAYSHAEGNNTKASGAYAHAEGSGSNSSLTYYYRIFSSNNVIQGSTTEVPGAKAENSHTEGSNCVALYSIAHAEGQATCCNETAGHAEGFQTYIGAYAAHAEGYCCSATGGHSHAEGTYSLADASEAHAEGYYTLAHGSSSHAEGIGGPYTYLTGGVSASLYAGAHGNASHSEGQYCYANGSGSHAEGGYTRAGNDYAHAEGNYTFASGASSHTEGYGTYANNTGAHAEGYQTFASGYATHAEGLGNGNTSTTYYYYGTYYDSEDQYRGRKTSSTMSLTPGATGDYSHVEGYKTFTSGNYGHAEGYMCMAINGGHAEGNSTYAIGNGYSHAEGQYTYAGGGGGSHAEGQYTYASGSGGEHSEGMYTCAAGGGGNHAEGHTTLANGSGGCHAEGYFTITSAGYGAHAEGSHTQAVGSEGCHAEGYYTICSGGLGGHAEGYYSLVASGSMATHAEGFYTIARGEYSHVGGKYNVADEYQYYPEWVAGTSYQSGDIVRYYYNSNWCKVVCRTQNSDSTFDWAHWTQEYDHKFAEIIGNGSADNERSNARALDWDGNEYLNGDLYINCNADSTGGTKVATESFVNSKVSVTIPAPPTSDGTYVLACVISNGVARVAWTVPQGDLLPYASGVIF